MDKKDSILDIQSCVKYSTCNCGTRYNTGTFVPDKGPGTFGPVLCTLYRPQVQGTMYLHQKYLVPDQVLCTWYLSQVLCTCPEQVQTGTGQVLSQVLYQFE